MEMFKQDGRTSEGRVFAILGKLAAFGILCWHADVVIENEWALIILLTSLIAPKLFEKVLYMRAGGKVEPLKGS